MSHSNELHDIVIVGSGMCGMSLAIMANKAMPYAKILIIEKEKELGGTWNLNTYPGAGCDIPSHFYSFSFAMKPDWTRFLSRQSEINEYQRQVANKFNVRRFMRFQTGCDSAKWDAEKKLWNLYCTNEQDGSKTVITTRAFVPAVGALHLPNDCEIKGAEKFKGSIFHSARWDHTKSYKDKDVVVVGNGCSATQFVPIMVKDAKQVRQFIRSMHYLMPNPDFVYSEKAKKRFAKFPQLMVLYRALLAGILDISFLMFFTKGIGAWLRGKYQTRIRNYITEKCPPKYHDIIVPDFKIGCKRRVMDTGYLDCLHKDNMFITRDPLVEIKEHSVVSKSGEEYPADMIVLANGFKTGKFVVDIHGANGETLDEHWARHGQAAYFSTCISGFPNMFISMGPNSGTGHYSYIFTSECQNNFIISLLKEVVPKPPASLKAQRVLMVKPEAEEKDSKWIDDATARTIVGPNGGCTSWYTSGTRNIALYPQFQMHYWWRSEHVQWNDFTIDGKSAESRLGGWLKTLTPMCGAAVLGALMAKA